MAADQSTVSEAYRELLEQPPEALVSIALLMVGAVAKAWQTYSDRPQPKRIGRRAADLDCDRITHSQTKIEKELEELSDEVKILAGLVRALEARQAGTAAP